MKIDKKFLATFYPFADFAVASNCFMPNFTLLFSGGMYRSQFPIHANWSRECSFLNDFVLKRKVNYAKEREKG